MALNYNQEWSEPLTQQDSVVLQIGLQISDNLSLPWQDGLSFRKTNTGVGTVAQALFSEDLLMGPQGDLVKLLCGCQLILSDQQTLVDSIFYVHGGGSAGNVAFLGDNENAGASLLQETFVPVLGLTLKLSDNLNQWLDPQFGSVDSSLLRMLVTQTKVLSDQLVMADATPTFIGDYALVLACPHLGQNWQDRLQATIQMVLADSLSLSDSLSIGYGNLVANQLLLSDLIAVGYGDLLSDSITITDSAVLVQELDELLSDQMTFSDSSVVTLGLTELLSDQLVFSDSLNIGYGNSLVDTMSLSDSVALLFALSNTFSETLLISDAVGLGYGFQIADVESLSDNVSLALSIVVLLSDQMLLSDSIAVGYGNAVKDQLSLSDALVIGYGAQITDSMTFSDSLLVGYGLLLVDQMTLSDSLGLQLLSSLLSLALSDSLTMSDAMTLGYSNQITDALTLSDGLGLGVGTLFSDSLSLTEAAVTVLGQNELFSDTLAFSDSLKIGYGLLFADQLTMTDALVFFPGWAPGDQMVFVEQVGIGYGMFISDSLNNWLEIFQSGQPVIQLILSDQMVFAEVLGVGYGCLVNDQGALTDQAAFVEAMLLLIADATPAQLDALAMLLDYGLRVNDAVVFQEQLVLMYGLIVGTESLSMADFIIQPQFLNVISLALADTDAANWLDVVLSQLIFSPSQIVLLSLTVLAEAVAAVVAVAGEVQAISLSSTFEAGAVTATVTPESVSIDLEVAGEVVEK